MELRVLRYFLTAAQEGSISRAAEYLHLTQPTLSRQLIELEKELGVKLFLRGGRGLKLTEDGERLRRRAEEILELSDRTLAEFVGPPGELTGEVAIGTVGPETMELIVRAAASLRRKHPKALFQLYGGSYTDVIERLDKGLLDFGALVQPEDLDRYDYLPLPYQDAFGILVRADDPLAGRKVVRPQDLRGSMLLAPNREGARVRLNRWLGPAAGSVTYTGSYNLAMGAVQMVRAGYSRAYCAQKGAEACDLDGLVFLPMENYPELGCMLVWKKHQRLSRLCEAFLAQVAEELEKTEHK